MGLFPTSLRVNTLPPKSARHSWWFSLFVLCAVLGALIGFSFKTQNRIRQSSVPASNYPALVQEYLILKKNVNDQQGTIAQLRRDNSRLVTSSTTGDNQAQVLAAEYNQAQFFAGLTAVHGPGLIATLVDSKKQYPPMPAGLTPPNIIHDMDINTIVNELKSAGAEAIAVNDQRLVANSWIRCAGSTIYINATPETPPYVIRAIGDPAKLQAALNLPGGEADQIRQIDPAMIKMQKFPRITLPAYAGATQPKYAKPVSPAATEAGSGTKDQG